MTANNMWRQLRSLTQVCSILLVWFLPGNVSLSYLDKPPQIIKDLNKFTQLKFGSFNRFVLECRGDGSPSPDYSWYKDGVLLSLDQLQDQDIMSDEEHSQLDFISPAPHHEGYYHCEAKNRMGLAKSSVTHVTASAPVPPQGSSPPLFISGPKTELKSLGSRVELECKAKGTPEPVVSWTKNGVPMPEETGTTLIIPSLATADVANYACNASNIAGYEYKNVIVNILTTAARIKEGPRAQLVASKGSNVTLKCVTDGYPAPTITWSVNDVEISANDDKYSFDQETGSLTVIQATMDDDGRYQCKAANHGEATAEGELIVKSVTTIVDGPLDRTEMVDTSISMDCGVVADTSLELSVSWKKDNIDLGQPGFLEDKRVYQDANHTLYINDLTFDDEGIYTCVARTSLNEDTATGLLTVVGINPIIVPPESSEESLLEADRLRLPCTLTQGYPAPTVQWFKGEDKVDTSRVTVHSDNSLEIYSLVKSDSGVYTCQASNSQGRDTIEVTLAVRQRTSIVSKPVHVQLSQVNSNSAQVIFPCDVEVDDGLRWDTEVTWYRDSVELTPSHLPPTQDSDFSPCDMASDEGVSMFLLANHSLALCSVDNTHVGSYHCEVSTSLEPGPIKSSYSSVYISQPFPWWILIIIVSVLIFFLIMCMVCYCKRRHQGKGYYGMDIEDGVAGKHNKSDIYYTTEDNESIMDEVDQSMLEKQNGKTPIFTPRTIKRLARVDKSIGSIGSLLDDDEYLDKGYDEDGSFRERYAE